MAGDDVSIVITLESCMQLSSPVDTAFQCLSHLTPPASLLLVVSKDRFPCKICDPELSPV